MKPTGIGYFLLLIAAQAAHSIEETCFRLWEVFLPAKLLVDIAGGEPLYTFAFLNGLLVVTMLACAVIFLNKRRFVSSVAWVWVLIELGNGFTHITMYLVRDGYFPGVYTAPVLILFSIITAKYVKQT